MSEPAAPEYSYRPSLMGAPYLFRLSEEGLVWTAGYKTGVWRYDEIVHIQLSYRPVSAQSYRFRTDILGPDNRNLPVVSATWQGMAAMVRQDEAYRAFILELHRRIAAHGRATFGAGLRRPLYILGVAAAALMAVALAGLLLRAITTAMWSGALFLVGCGAFFGWQTRSFLGRNRPRTYTPDDVPADLLPSKKETT